jgi:hypothetical protein
MSFPGRRIVSSVADANRAIGEVTDYLTRERGEVLSLEAVGAATVRLTHKLGRIPQFFSVLSKNANADIWRDDDDPWDSAAVTFRTSAAITSKVRVW